MASAGATGARSTETAARAPPAGPEIKDVFWFATGVLVEELDDCQAWPPTIEMTVTGHTRRRRDPRRPQLGRLVEVNGTDVVLFRWGERVFASESRCPHMKGRLELGDIEDLGSRAPGARGKGRPHRTLSLGLETDFDDLADGKPPAQVSTLCISCPVHGFQFDPVSGVSIMPPESFRLQVFPVRLRPPSKGDTTFAPRPPPSPGAPEDDDEAGDAPTTFSGRDDRLEVSVGFERVDVDAFDAEDF